MRFNIGPCKTSFNGSLDWDELEDVQAFLSVPLGTSMDQVTVQAWARGRNTLRLMFVDGPKKGSITNE